MLTHANSITQRLGLDWTNGIQSLEVLLKNKVGVALRKSQRVSLMRISRTNERRHQSMAMFA